MEHTDEFDVDPEEHFESSTEDTWFASCRDCPCCHGYIYKCSGMFCLQMGFCHCAAEDEHAPDAADKTADVTGTTAEATAPWEGMNLPDLNTIASILGIAPESLDFSTLLTPEMMIFLSNVMASGAPLPTPGAAAPIPSPPAAAGLLGSLGRSHADDRKSTHKAKGGRPEEKSKPVPVTFIPPPKVIPPTAWMPPTFGTPQQPRLDTGLLPTTSSMPSGVAGTATPTPSSIADIWAHSPPSKSGAGTAATSEPIKEPAKQQTKPTPAKSTVWGKGTAPAADLLFKHASKPEDGSSTSTAHVLASAKPPVSAPTSSPTKTLPNTTGAMDDDITDDLMDPISQQKQDLNKEVKRLRKKLREIEGLEKKVDLNDDQKAKVAAKAQITGHLKDVEEQLRLLSI